MAVTLSKGQRVSLDKDMTMALIGLGWDPNCYDGSFDFDLDASAFLLTKNGKVRSERDFVFYNNLEHESGAVKSMGDDRTGGNSEDGDDEQIIIDFTKIPANIEKIAIVVTIHDAEVRRQNFGQVSNAYVRVAKIFGTEDSVGKEELRYNLGEDFSIETAVLVCEIYRNGNGWKFNAVGAGYQGGLAAFCRQYGVDYN